MRQLSLVAAALLMTVIGVLWHIHAGPVGNDRQSGTPAAHEEPAPSADISSTAAAVEPGHDPRLQQIADALRARYADRIHLADWQIRVLTHLIDLLQELYPQSWQEAIVTVLQLAFPNQSDILIERLEAWLDYQRWIDDVFNTMSFVDADDRYQTIWSKRYSLFGDDAEVIWGAELMQQAFNESVAAIDQSPGSIEQKSQAYIALVRDTWGEGAFGNHGRHTTQLMQDFVKLQSVQAELRDMSSQVQDETLANFRRDMGLDEDAIARWSELDSERREQWNLGEEYMTRRSQLTESFQGAQQQQAINELQIELFGADEARFIQNEEASGVFGFEQEQVIGLN